jgi:hypothetical protein
VLFSRDTTHTMSHKIVAGLVVALMLGALPARADDAKTSKPADKTAEALSSEAYELYQKGAFTEALAVYSRAYEKEPASAILFNMARIYEKKLFDRAKAAEYYRRYLGSGDTEPALVDKAKAFLATLDAAEKPATIPDSPEPPPPPPAQPPPPDDDDGARTAMRVGAWTSLGLGLVGIGVGAVAGIVAMNKKDEAGGMCEGSACSSSEGVELYGDARTAATVSTIGFTAAGVLLATGVTLLLVAPSASSEGTTAVSVSPRVGPGVASVSVSGGWW